MKLSKIMNVTEKALTQIKSIFEIERPGDLMGLRLAVIGGGCSGLQYKIEFSEVKDKDHIVETEGLKILIDPKSSLYLKDVTLDFNDGLNGKGFVFQNPNATNTCGCGESFSV